MPVARASSAPPLSTALACYDVVAVGAEAAGKTSLLTRARWQRFVAKYLPTLGTEYYALVDRRRSVQLCVWEAGGQQRFAPVQQKTLRTAQAIVYVFDASREDSLLELLERADALDEVATAACVRVLVATKADLVTDATSDPRSLERAIACLGVDGFFMTSAATGAGVAELFDGLVAALQRRAVRPTAIYRRSLSTEWRVAPNDSPQPSPKPRVTLLGLLEQLSCGCLGARVDR